MISQVCVNVLVVDYFFLIFQFLADWGEWSDGFLAVTKKDKYCNESWPSAISQSLNEPDTIQVGPIFRPYEKSDSESEEEIDINHASSSSSSSSEEENDIPTPPTIPCQLPGNSSSPSYSPPSPPQEQFVLSYYLPTPQELQEFPFQPEPQEEQEEAPSPRPYQPEEIPAGQQKITSFLKNSKKAGRSAVPPVAPVAALKKKKYKGRRISQREIRSLFSDV
jgi:hypothetical protein